MREVEFREGMRLVPDHVADVLGQYETYQLTYEQAMAKMNEGFARERLRKVQDDVIKKHLSRFGGQKP